jgi:hypothetical protein
MLVKLRLQVEREFSKKVLAFRYPTEDFPVSDDFLV